MRRRRISVFSVVNMLLLIGLVIVTLYPFLYMINVSLSSEYYVLRNQVSFWPKGFTWEYYETVLSDPRIFTGYKNTLIYVVVGTTLSLFLSGMGGYALSRKMVLRKTFTFMVVFTMLFSGGMIPTFLVVRGVGIMDTMWAMILPNLISVWNLILMRTFFMGLPSEMIDSGKVDGLNDLGVFFRLVLPLSKALLATIGLFYAVAIWNNFMSALLYLRDSSLFPLQMILRNIVIAGNVTTGGDGGAGGDTIISQSLRFATIIVGTLPILLVYPFIQKYFVKGVMIGSVKG